MTSKIPRIFIVALIVVLMSLSCHTSRKVTNVSKIEARSPEYVLKRLKDQQVKVDDFNARAKIKYDDGDQRISFVAQLRMREGYYIWISASFLTYEVARILIRPDSIFAINRLEKSFVSESYDKFNQSYEIPATYKQLEQLLLGNSIIDAQQPYDFQFVSDHYMMSQIINPISLFEKINLERLRADQVDVIDLDSHYQVSAQYDDFRNGIQSKEFSYFRQYIIKKDDIHLASIQLNFSDIDTDKKNAPFEIPNHYGRVD
ncbi:MAG: DUF4292 domain-containing protein [Saprospiraceae bacterium]|nr:DUF4292 domain-containing protein [Saprospiraceae bacterium]